ncbi:branched-chain amino acid ABC transporter ATP-binding protein [Pandoraea pneumonica]|uniref:Branched-chain amino acid ABC transporter ATP-binding protein n=1 Tax=Pandoraea pneumonica TaxID=2508299 RepID=A0A5E4SE48_9BURK|nr:ABC transporter ATP-binding protein [Pandoraea pneumonica]VVD74176.1 branched-chain amino acid ABC transporter ATP-binding protein [Pandoraea pneumonica]
MLEIQGLHAGYGNVPVLRDIQLSVAPGEILLVAGENGAGKSTLLRTIGGFIKPERGQIRLNGREIGGCSPEDNARAGLRLVLDGHRVFPEISVWDNLRLGGVIQRDKRAFSQAVEEVFSVFPALHQRLDQPARNLSGGQQQMLALGQAFVAQPKVLLSDEPSLGLAQALLPPILDFLKRWAARGTAIVIVEQHIDIALPVADRALVLERGQVKLTCPANELRARLQARQPVSVE